MIESLAIDTIILLKENSINQLIKYARAIV